MSLPRFHLRYNNQIYLDYSVNGFIRIRKFTGDYCDPDKWDQKRQRSKGNRSLNKFIDYVSDSVQDIKRDLQRTGMLTKSKFIQELDKKLGTGNTISFKEYFKQFGKTKNYVDSIKGVQKYLDDYVDMPLNSIDRDWFKGYKALLLKNNLSESTCKTYHRILIAACHQAYRDDLIDVDPKKFNIKFNKVIKMNVRHTTDELDSLYHYPFENYFDFARDQYLIGCYTGARYNVYSELDDRFIQGSELVYQPKKNAGYIVRLDVDDRLLELLKRISIKRKAYQSKSYKGAYDKFLNNLSKLCETAGITKEVMIRDGSIKQFRKCDLVKTHTAKRTFACLEHEKGTSLIQIMKHLCHGSIQTTQRYLDATV